MYVFSVGNCIGPSLGNQKQIDTFVQTPILRDCNSQVDNIPGQRGMEKESTVESVELRSSGSGIETGSINYP